MRQCTRCYQFKPTGAYAIYWDNKLNRDREYSICKACRSKRHKINWGITNEEYIAMMQEQDYKCACCEDKIDLHIAQFQIDHWPGTAKRKENIRGLLCRSCNNGLGCFKDNIERLQKAIDYLRKASNANQHSSTEGLDILRTPDYQPVYGE